MMNFGTMPAAILLDVDGTLYRQGPLRRQMAVRLAQAHWYRPVDGMRTARCLAGFRRAQERLREEGNGGEAFRQYDVAAECSGLSVETVRANVSRWMEQEPLRFLKAHARPGLHPFLHCAREAGIKLGVLSDYPAQEKLSALGIHECIDVVVSAQDPEIGVFKPNPRGIEVALERLGVAPSNALYVGDRHEVDAAASHAAGVRCVIVGSQTAENPSSIAWTVDDFVQLGRELFDRD